MSCENKAQARYLSICFNTIMLSKHGLGPNANMELAANNCSTDIEIMLRRAHLFRPHNHDKVQKQVADMANHHANKKACHLCVNDNIVDKDLIMCPTSLETHNIRNNLGNPTLFRNGDTSRCRNSTHHEMYVVIAEFPCAPIMYRPNLPNRFWQTLPCNHSETRIVYKLPRCIATVLLLFVCVIISMEDTEWCCSKLIMIHLSSHLG